MIVSHWEVKKKGVGGGRKKVLLRYFVSFARIPSAVVQHGCIFGPETHGVGVFRF